MTAEPLFEVTRGDVVESLHYGSIAVVDSNGTLVASHGDPQVVAFLRSSAKPFQALPFVEAGGVDHFGLTEAELSIFCASHEGSDLHVKTVESIQEKTGVPETYLQCGIHMPDDIDAFRNLLMSNRQPTPNQNNCSGNHMAMLAYAKLRGLPLDNYLDVAHPVQQEILAVFGEMCGLPVHRIRLGTDGCSAPNFAVPLYNAGLAMARLCDPRELSAERAAACKRISAAMTAHPEMVSAYGEFDEQLMRVAGGGIVCKRGAEGFQIVGILPGVLGPGSAGLGVAMKVSDGDPSRTGLDLSHSARVRPAVTLEILRQLGALSPAKMELLAAFGPVKEVRNHRGIVTGRSRPLLTL